jgi:hypothetical protein
MSLSLVRHCVFPASQSDVPKQGLGSSLANHENKQFAFRMFWRVESGNIWRRRCVQAFGKEAMLSRIEAADLFQPLAKAGAGRPFIPGPAGVQGSYSA